MRARELRALALVVPALVAIEAAIRPALLIWSTFAPESYTAAVLSAPGAWGLAIRGIFILTLIVFGRWIYIAGRNLVDCGLADLQFSPASRIWWFAVPFANLIKPVEGIRELWNASHGETNYSANHWLITSWWILWLANGVLVLLVGRFGWEGAYVLFVVEAVVGLALAGVAIMLVRCITAAQLRLGTAPDLTEIFA